jgi:hypothetical protein
MEEEEELRLEVEQKCGGRCNFCGRVLSGGSTAETQSGGGDAAADAEEVVEL